MAQFTGDQAHEQATYRHHHWASSGLGFALAEAFLERGDNVVGNARSEARLEQAAARLGNASRFIGVAGDIAEPATAQRLFAKAAHTFGGVDILINNAGIFIAKRFAEYTAMDVDALVGTNLKGFFYPAQEAARIMTQQGHGQIIAITASIALQPDTRVPALLPVLVKAA
jgi:NAD(P)-dependent dehydrogenase (short-subunit alcohol dehydrogenase family)